MHYLNRWSIASLLTIWLFVSCGAFGNLILIDFSDHSGSGGAGWNTIPRASTTSTNTFELTTSTGLPSGLSIGPFNAASIDGANVDMNVTTTGSPSVTDVNDIPSWANLNAVNDYFLRSAAGTGGFVISGFTPGIGYEIELIAFTTGAQRIADYNFDLYNTDTEAYRSVGSFTGINSRYTAGDATFTGAVLSISFTPGANETDLRVLSSGSGGGDWGAFNAMQIIPEPSSILLLAAGALGIWFARRRV